KHKYDNDLLDGSQKEQEEKNLIKQLFKDLNFDNGTNTLEEVLMELTKYENQELATGLYILIYSSIQAALNLLFRNSSQKEELASLLSRVELLVSTQMMKTYNTLADKISRLRNILDSRLTEGSSNQALEIFNFIIDDVKKHGAKTQRILMNL